MVIDIKKNPHSQPFDLVKVRLQTTEGVYKNTADCFKQIVKKDGLTGLYRGMATPLASVTPIFAVSFWVSFFKIKKEDTHAYNL